MRRGLTKLLKGDKAPQSQPPSTGGLQPPTAYPPQPSPSPTPSAATSTGPSHGDVFRDQGLELSENEQYDGAIAMYDAALKHNPSDTTALLYRSYAHSLRPNPRFDLAIQDADSTIGWDPTNWKAWKQKGELLRKQGNYQGAIEALEHAVGCSSGIDRMGNKDLLKSTQAAATQSSAPTVPDKIPQDYDQISYDHSVSAHSSMLPAPTTLAERPKSGVSAITTSEYSQPTSPLPGPSSYQPFVPTPEVNPVTTPSEPAPVETKSPTLPPRKPAPVEYSPPPAPATVETSSPTTKGSPPNITTTSPGFNAPIISSTVPPPVHRTPSTTATPSTLAQPPTPNITTTTAESTAPAISSTVLPDIKRTPSATAMPPTLAQAPTPQPPQAPQQVEASRPNVTAQAPRQPQVVRSFNAETVNQTPNTTALPISGADLLNAPQPNEPPPGYTPPTPMTVTEVNRRLDTLSISLAGKNKGSLNIRPYTTADGIDAIQLLYVGMVQGELTNREIGRPVYLHTTFNSMVVDNYGYPGSTWLDMDPESSAYYEGKLPGTVGISGYSEEYRTHQLLISPLLNLSLEGQTGFREVPIDTVVSHMRRVQMRPNTEDDEALKNLFGLSQIDALNWGFSSTGTRQKRIDSICLALSRSLYAFPERFVDFAKARNFSQHTLGTAAQGIGMRNFLFQILIGAELLIRLRKEPATTSWRSIVTDNISALLVLSSLWMQHVTIQGPKEGAHRYLIYAHDQQRHSEALIRFAEALQWPYMDEARAYIESAYSYLTSGQQSVGFDICDWLYGLILPGKIFRHRIMACLVYASPTIRTLNAAPYFENGLVVQNKSYWPKRTVLARVLGGLRNPKAICGWVGPFPAPSTPSGISGWVRLNARRVDIPTPVVAAGDALAHFGFDPSTENTTVMIDSLTDPVQWIQPTPPTAPAAAINDTSASRALFKAIELSLIPPASSPPLINADLPQEEYRATLVFNITGSEGAGASGIDVRYTLYSNPVFITAPPCVGTHYMHIRQAQKYLDSCVKVADLKNYYGSDNSYGGISGGVGAGGGADELTVIDALGQGEEAVARAWCAERARHAVVRRGEGCCFACAAALATGEKGMGVGVLIWTR